MEVYDPETVDWYAFLLSPSPENAIRRFDNFVARRGTGLGNVLRSLVRIIRPLLKKAGRAGINVAKTQGKAILKRGARIAKDEAINVGKAVLDDLSKDHHAPVTHIIRDRTREASLKFAQRVRRGRGLGSTNKRKQTSSLGIVKAERPKRGRALLPPVKDLPRK